jgi:hypothetical protein
MLDIVISIYIHILSYKCDKNKSFVDTHTIFIRLDIYTELDIRIIKKSTPDIPKEKLKIK